MKLTKLKALELCEEMWRELAEKGCCKHETISYQKYFVGCFACAYEKQYGKSEDDCMVACPLAKLWPKGCQSDKRSPYFRWDNAKSIFGRKKNALLIADFCKKEIAKLKRKK